MTNAHPAASRPPYPVVAGLTFRPLAEPDVDAWLELVKRIAAHEKAPWHAQYSELVAAIFDEVNPVTENSIVGVDKSGVPRAFGRVSKNVAGEKAHVSGGVDPSWQRRGVGAAILAWQEAQTAARFLQDGQGHPTARDYVEEDNPALAALLSDAGYSIVRYFSEMVRPLDQAPETTALEGISIVTWTPDLSEAARVAHNEAFADHWGSEPRSVEQWQIQMKHEHLRLDLSTLAMDNATGEVLGYQLASVDPESTNGRKEGYTELLGVRRPWRGRGIAPALLLDAMARFSAAGLEFAALDVDTENPSGAHGLYARMGYVPVRSSMAWDKAL